MFSVSMHVWADCTARRNELSKLFTNKHGSANQFQMEEVAFDVTSVGGLVMIFPSLTGRV